MGNKKKEEDAILEHTKNVHTFLCIMSKQMTAILNHFLVNFRADPYPHVLFKLQRYHPLNYGHGRRCDHY